MEETRQAVADTGFLVAAMRAEESERPDRLFTDPYADRLAGAEGRALLARAAAKTGASSPQIAIRTRFWDEALHRAESDGLSQVVILAAGMDARAYRLPWRPTTTVYEVDQPQVIRIKDQRLAGARPRCRRVPVGVDLADDWPKALISHGFSSDTPAAWLVEGLLQYLDAADVEALFARIDALSAPGSRVCYDLVGAALLEADFMQPTLEYMRRSGAPWTFGTDAPATLIERHGWLATVTDVAEPGARWNRWDHPVVPLEVPGVPRGYFVEATKP